MLTASLSSAFSAAEDLSNVSTIPFRGLWWKGFCVVVLMSDIDVVWMSYAMCARLPAACRGDPQELGSGLLRTMIESLPQTCREL